MKKCIVVLALVFTALAAAPDASEACFRRRGVAARPVVVCCPVVVCPPVVPIPPAVATVTIKGKTYRLTETGERGEFEETDVQPPAVTAGTGIADHDIFKGKDRRVPKTTLVSIEDAPLETFASVSALLPTFTSDDKMALKKIGREPTSDRVKDETRNVRVSGFVYAFKKEADNDYHVILGDAPDIATKQYLNVEVSGIPVGGTVANRNTLIGVRKDFKEAFGLGPNGPGGYTRLDPPVPVRITGSVFWDVDHAPGVVGPTGLRPKTAWEIHPVSRIEFLDP